MLGLASVDFRHHHGISLSPSQQFHLKAYSIFSSDQPSKQIGGSIHNNAKHVANGKRALIMVLLKAVRSLAITLFSSCIAIDASYCGLFSDVKCVLSLLKGCN